MSNNTRPFCEKINEHSYYKQFNLKKATKITLFEKMCLAFIDTQYFVDETEGTTLVYKKLRGKTYVLNHFVNPPKQYNCRHKMNFKNEL